MPGGDPPRNILPTPLAMRATPVLAADLYHCECPVGEDHDVYFVFDQRWRALCTHGCKEGDILQAFGMSPDALHPPPLVYIAYPYHAPDGTLLFEVVRRPNVPMGWDRFFIREHARPFESSLVYRLPEMLAAPLDVPVYWPEGEKDVEALRALGLIAVTTSDGPVPYDPRKVLRWFEGRKVVLLPDNDEAGHLYAARIEASLRGIASSVTRLQLPAGVKDVSEWLAGGGRLSDLLEAVPGALEGEHADARVPVSGSAGKAREN